MNSIDKYQPAKYIKAQAPGSPVGVGSSAGDSPNLPAGDKRKASSTKRNILLVLGLLLFVVGGVSVFLISNKQTTAPEAPTAPQSQPAAYIEEEDTCTLSFVVTAPEVTPTVTLTITPSATPSVTLTPTATPSATPTITPTATPSATPTITPELTPTVTPEETATPTIIATVTPKTTTAPTTAVTPVVTNVVTTVGCNEGCNENADCSNISHICYNGACRLDVNPDDDQCRLPNGETVVQRTVTPVDYTTGPSDWLNYLKIGIGALGLGALLLLLL